MSSPALEHGPRALYRQEFERLRREFEATGSGRASLRDRTQFVDKLALQLWEQHVPPTVRSGFALAALGGFGRGALFPHSDIDLLFLAENDALRGTMKDPVRSMCQEMWDTGLRVSPTTRTLDECARFDPDNVEFTVSLLDCRFLSGDAKLFERLHEKSLPQLVARESDVLMQRLAEVTRTRHLRFGDTIFHLEPNLKEGPGGLRDLHVSRWLETIMALASERKWPDTPNAQPNSESDAVLDAMDFLTSTRCYLHYRGNRDENVISWEAQDELAKRGIATNVRERFVRRMDALVFSPCQDHPSACAGRCWNSFPENVLRCTARFSTGARAPRMKNFRWWMDASISQQTAGARDPFVILRLFTFVARHGVALSVETERRLDNARRGLADTMPLDSRLWEHLREILVLPYAADALRAMHSLGLLTLAIPEFEAIDSLVLRDLYHRYTVDEHSILAIEMLHRLATTDVEWLQPFAGLLTELERPELLFLALLLHDTGKGMEGTTTFTTACNSLRLSWNAWVSRKKTIRPSAC